MTTEKLVRDKIPEIIRAKGEQCVTRVARDKREAFEFLVKKLGEETTEFLAADKTHMLEELGDMQEVICALAELFGYSRVDLLLESTRKRNERGGFSKQIIMQID